MGALACLVVCSCDDAGSPVVASGKAPSQVAVWEATTGPLETRRSWPATIEPLRILEVVAPANGRLAGVSVETGDLLEVGMPMMTLRFPEGEAARAALATRAEVLKGEVARLEGLAGSRAVSEAETATMRIEKLETLSRLDAIEALLAEGEIIAPVAGTVLETLVSPGSLVVEGMVLARVADAASPGIRLEVPSPELRYFETTDSLAVTADGLPADGLEIRRIVRFAGGRANAARLELWLAPDAGIAVPAAATITHASSREALMIPWSAVATDDERTWVGRVDKASGEVRRVDIVAGATSGTRVEVVEGVSAGDWVVRHDPRSFADGAVVAAEPATPHEGP